MGSFLQNIINIIDTDSRIIFLWKTVFVHFSQTSNMGSSNQK